MKQELSILLILSIVAIALFSATPPTVSANASSALLSDDALASISGGGAWAQFFSGVTCGIGVTIAMTGYVSGVGAIPAALMTAGILTACANAFGL